MVSETPNTLLQCKLQEEEVFTMSAYNNSVISPTELNVEAAVQEAMMLSNFFAKAQQGQEILEIPVSYISPTDLQEMLEKGRSPLGIHIFSPEDCTRKCEGAYKTVAS